MKDKYIKKQLVNAMETAESINILNEIKKTYRDNPEIFNFNKNYNKSTAALPVAAGARQKNRRKAFFGFASILVAVIMGVTLGIIYLVNPNNNPTVVAAPTNLQLNGITLTWEAVPNATGYEIDIDGVKYIIDNKDITSFTIPSEVTEICQIKIKASGGSNSSGSEWANETNYNVHRYNLAVIAETGGNVDSSGGFYVEGAAISLTASPKTGYLFDGWYNGGVKVSENPIYTFNMPASNLILDARFIESAYFINAQIPQVYSATVNNMSNVELDIFINSSISLGATGFVNDGGVLTYEWFVNTENSVNSGTPTSIAITQNTTASQSFSTTLYYYCVITNTNNSVNGVKAASAVSEIFKINWKWLSLEAPTNLQLSNGMLSWDPVIGAIRYKVDINNSNWGNPTATSLSIANAIKTPNTYLIRVCAIAGEGFSNSAYTQITHIVESIEFVFTLINGDTSYEVGWGNATTQDIIIPDTYNSLPVTRIAFQGFRNITSVRSVIIPDSVTSISTQAFQGCTSLMSVVIPASVISISSLAFERCTSLRSITIPTNAILQNQVFNNCTNITIYTSRNRSNDIATIYASGWDYQSLGGATGFIIFGCTLSADQTYVVSKNFGGLNTGVVSLNDGSTINAPTRVNKTFAGWSSEQDGAVEYTASGIKDFFAASSKTFYSIWT